MAKYLGIPLTISNGNKVPITAQPNKVENPTFEGTQTPSGVNFVLSSGWRLNNSGAGAAASSSEFTSEGAKIEWPAANPPSSTYLRAWNVSSASNLIVFTKGKAYKMTYTISSSNNDSGLRLENGASIISLPTTVGTHEVDLVADIETFTIIRNNTVSSGATIVVSSVYVKEIAATETPTYGSPELVTNGDFNDASDWSGTNWTISGNGKAVHATTNTNYLIQSMGLELGKKYAIQWTVADYSSGTLGISSASGTKSGDDTVSANGTYNTVLVSNGTTLQIYATGVASLSSVSVKEVPYVTGTREFVKNGDFSDGTNGWDATTEAELSISSGRLRVTSKTAGYEQGYQNIPVEAGKTYRITGDVYYVSGVFGVFYVDGLDENNAYHEYGLVNVNSTNTTNSLDITFTALNNSITIKAQTYNNPSGLAVEVDNISLKELEYNYLQVADGGFTKSVKEGDVVFNTSTGTEGVVKEVIDNNVLLMSNDNFSTADEFFNVFAANGDTRGNQLIKTDNYIMSEYDENTSNPQESSFWFAGGKNSDKVVLTQLNPATNTFFVAGVIEEYLERLNSQSATDSRLDIPLDAFRDHQYNEILTTTAITLS